MSEKSASTCFFLLFKKGKPKNAIFFCLRKKNRQWQCWIRDDLIENLIFFKFIFQILFGSLVERKPKFGSGTNTPAHWERYVLLTYFWYGVCFRGFLSLFLQPNFFKAFGYTISVERRSPSVFLSHRFSFSHLIVISAMDGIQLRWVNFSLLQPCNLD